MKSTRQLILSVVFACSLGTAPSLFGQTFWNNAGTGNWNTAANWTLGVPNSASGTAFDAVIENGGTAQLLAIPAGNVRRLRVGRAAGGGNLLVDAAALTVTENYNLNESGGGVTTTTVQNGGSIITPATIIAFTAGTTSNFTVTGTNSLLSSTALTVGSGGTGTLNIQNNATVATSTLSINGTSNVNLNNGTLRFVSATGLNRVNYIAGTIQLPDTNDFITDPRVLGLFGSFPVIPVNKTLKIEGLAGLRNLGLTVNGGTLAMASMITGDLFDRSGGGMSIVNGGKVTNTGTVSLGTNPDATSTDIVVRGAGSSWTLNSNMFLGYATVTLQEQGLLYVGTDLNTTVDGQINVQGGTLRLNTVSGSGLGRIAFSAGTIQLAGSHVVGSDAAINYFFGAAPVLTQLKSLAIEGVASLNNLVTVDGGTFSVGQLSNGSLLDFKRGTLSFTNQNVVIGASGPLGDTLDLAQNQTINSTLGITNQGLVTGDGRIGGGAFNNDASGELRGEAGRTLTLGGANNSNSGRIYLQGGTVDFNQNLTNAATGQLLGRGTLMTGGSGLLNQGHIALSGGVTDIFGDVANNTANAARGVSISGNSDVTFWDDVNNVAGSLFRVSGASSATFFGTYSGAGISGTGNVYFEADVTPGASPARVDFGGSISFGSNATLVMELGGTTAGTQYDQVNVAGQLTLGGTLEISLINGFTPTAGQTFQLLSAGSITGAFSSIVLPTVPGLSWNTSQLTTGILSVVELLGDYNQDGTVNAADYTIYRNRKAGIGGTTLPNDAGSPGVTFEDYVFWKANYGKTAGSGAGQGNSSSNVPEPATLLVAWLALAAITSLRSASPRSR